VSADVRHWGMSAAADRQTDRDGGIRLHVMGMQRTKTLFKDAR
jgi:hypothetical protein